MREIKGNYITIEIENVDFNKVLAFPVFIYLKLNKRYVCFQHPGHAMGPEKQEKLKKKRHKVIWVPVEYQQELRKYVQDEGKDPADLILDDPNTEGNRANQKKEEIESDNVSVAASVAETTTEFGNAGELVPGTESEQRPNHRFAEKLQEDHAQNAEDAAEFVDQVNSEPDSAVGKNIIELPVKQKADAQAKQDNTSLAEQAKELGKEEAMLAILESEAVSEEGKDAFIAAACNKSYADFANFQTDDNSFFGQINELANQILRSAATEEDWYEDILRMKAARKVSHHSNFTLCMSLLVAMTVLRGREKEYKQLLAAALLHDIGLIDKKWPTKENNNNHDEGHLKHALKTIKSCFPAIDKVILEIIEQHHENFDGSGLPNKKWHQQIHPFAQCIRMADLIEDLMRGRYDGNCYSPLQALQKLQKLSRNEKSPTYINPEFVHMLLMKCQEHSTNASGVHSESA